MKLGRRKTNTVQNSGVNRPMTADELQIAINRLQVKIVNEHGGQVECDRLEAELQALIAQQIVPIVKPVSRRSSRSIE